jgi:hypothetical protein
MIFYHIILSLRLILLQEPLRQFWQKTVQGSGTLECVTALRDESRPHNILSKKSKEEPCLMHKTELLQPVLLPGWPGSLTRREERKEEPCLTDKKEQVQPLMLPRWTSRDALEVLVAPIVCMRYLEEQHAGFTTLLTLVASHNPVNKTRLQSSPLCR